MKTVLTQTMKTGVTLAACALVGAAAAAQQVDILVESGLKASIQSKLDQYAADLAAEGYAPEVIAVNQADSPAAIRNTLKSHFAGSGLRGVVVVGKVPFVYYKWPDRNVAVSWYTARGQVPGYGAAARDVFPTYYCYSDLDGAWGGLDAYGNYTTIAGDPAPEVWVGVIRADKLHKTGRTEAELISAYFDRLHAYRAGTLPNLPPARTLGALLSDDSYYYGWEGFWRSQNAILTPGAATVMNDYPPAAAYLDAIGDSTGYRLHWYKSAMFWTNTVGFYVLNAATEIVTLDDVLPREPRICFYAFVGGCSSGNFDVDNYWAGAHVFETSHGLASVLSASNDGGALFSTPHTALHYAYLRQGRCLGEALLAARRERNITNDLGGHIIGDPTLRLCSRTPLGAELAAGRAVTGSANAARITDTLLFDSNTWYSADASAQTLTIDLAAGHRVGGVLIAWDERNAGRDYAVLSGASSAGPWTAQKSVTGSAQVAALAEFAAPADCRYVRLRMTASNGARYGIREVMVFESTGSPPQPPAPPGNLTATPKSTSRIDLTWSDNSADEDGFKVDRRRSGAVDWVRIATPGANATARSDTGLPARTKFYYKVKACNAAGNSDYSNLADATTAAAANLPPVAAAGPDQFVLDDDGNGSESTTLAASGSFDPDGTIVAYVWKEDGTLLATGTVVAVRFEAGVHTVTLVVTDDDGATATDTLTVMIVQPLAEFTAYNDLGWDQSQRAANITWTGTGENAPLVDYATGRLTPVTLAVAGGRWPGDIQGAGATAGTDAAGVFDGIVDCRGLLSYSDTDLTFRFTGLDPALRYEFVLFGNRAEPAYTDRLSTVRISDVTAFENRSSPGTGAAAADDSVTIVNGDNTANGYVARFADIEPGADGDMLVTVSDGASRFYANALMLRGFKVQEAEVKVEKGATWTYRKGTTEASSPAGAWRQAAFDDSGWNSGPAPFGYGDGPYGTTLGDMQGSYSCVFLRHAFTIDTPACVGRIDLWAVHDDGFVMWLNGEELARVNVPGEAGSPVAHDTCAAGNAERLEWTRTLTGAAIPPLRAGTNVLAVQVFNVDLASSDLTFDAQLSIVNSQLSIQADADQDGMPDEWEAAHLSDLPDPADLSDADPDGDGLSNLEEYVAGTDPTDGSAVLGLHVQLASGAVLVSFPTVEAAGTGYAGSSRHYCLERRDVLGPDGNWAGVPGYEDIGGAGQTVTCTDTASSRPVMFRVRVWLSDE
ncbi:MAG: fibronectin type III domain-containing protein [Kiritimatiellae bacterium]|nr:fibronectin type III domain-containing protein [Kiritimatiellia bacterium]